MKRLLLVGCLLVGPLWGTSPAATDDRRVLRLARPNDPQTLDPARVSLNEDIVLVTLLCLPLLDVVEGARLTPNAAWNWSAAADARTFTFYLRPDLKFANGRAVVADDYVFSFKRMLDPRTGSPLGMYLNGIRGAAAFAQARTGETTSPPGADTDAGGRGRNVTRIDGLRAADAHTLVVELEQPDPTFPMILAQPFMAAVPQEEVTRDETGFANRPIGTGPYVVQEWKRGIRLVLTPNPHYTGVEPRHFDRIEIMIGGDSATHLMMFERAEIDLVDIQAFAFPPADHLRIIRDRRWNSCIEQADSPFSLFAVLNTEIQPLDNRKVRQALNFAVNKPRCLRSANGRITPAGGLLPPFMPGFNPEMRGYAHDPERARVLLRESGVPLPVRLTLWHNSLEQYREIAEAVQFDLRQVGVEIELKSVAPPELIESAFIRGKVQVAITGWASSLPDPKDMLGSPFDGRNFASTTPTNLSYYNNPEVNRLLDEAAVTVDLPLRYARYRRIEEIIVYDAPCIFLGYPEAFALKQPCIKGRLIEPLWPFRLDRIWKE